MMRFKILLSMALLFAVGSANAADETLDPTFTDGVDGPGRVAIPFDVGGGLTDIAVKILRQADGKYVVVGVATLANPATTGIALARVLPNGALDPSFAAGAGKRVKDACFSNVRNAALDNLGRIVVVGEVASLCSGNTTTDVGVVRFNTDGSDDTSFAGDGGIGFKFQPGSDGIDRGGAVLILADNSMIVGGSVKVGSDRHAVMQKVSATGVVAATPPTYALVPPAEVTFTDAVMSPGGTSTWLVQRITNDTATVGSVKRVFNADLSPDTSLGGAGEQFIDVVAASGYNACGGPHTATSVVLYGDTIKVFGYANDTVQRTWFASMRASNGAVKTYGCIDFLNSAPVDFATTSAVVAGMSIYLGGQCGGATTQAVCLWRVVPRDSNPDRLQADVAFAGGGPASAPFLSASVGQVSGIGFSVIRDGNKTVVAGSRQWANADNDFAIARFGDGLTGDAFFADGFE